MNKTLRKITASFMAVTTLAVSMVGMSANAADPPDGLNIRQYSSRYIGGGAPGSASYTDERYLTAYGSGYYGYCRTLDLTGTTGKVSIYASRNYTSDTLEITQPRIGGTLYISGYIQPNKNAYFKFSCYGNNTVYSTGYLKTGTTPAPNQGL